MNCRSAESYFSPYLEDEISQEERRALESHLMGCRRCSAGIREMRATISLMHQLPEVSPSSHFDDDLFARIRSGEGIRPSLAEIIRELLSPARLRPAFMTGAAACAVLIAVTLSPAGRSLIAKRGVQEPARSTASAPVASQTIATAPAAAPAGAVAPRAPERAPVVASAPSRVLAVRDSIVDSRIPEPRYMDEIINDRFYIDRGSNAESPSVVPVNESSDDGVYIIF